jgi:hypothetical protein
LDGDGGDMNKELKPGQRWKMEENGRYSFEILSISLSGNQLSYKIASDNGYFKNSPIAVMKVDDFRKSFRFLVEDVE